MINEIRLNQIQNKVLNKDRVTTFFGDMVKSLNQVEKSVSLAQEGKIDIHELSTAMVDATRLVEQTTSVVKSAVNAYQEIMKISS